MKGVEQLYKSNESKGVAELKKFQISPEEERRYNLSQLFNGTPIMKVDSGTFVKLYVDGELMMSDTRMERITNCEFIANAKGDVMIAGLGIGLILHNLRDKVKSGEVTSITVYEKCQDVIDLIGPKFSSLPIKIICQDILEYKPAKQEKYDTIYFDIWPTIDYSKNLPEIKMLHNRWKSHKKDKSSWMDSWMKKYMQDMKRKDDREDRLYGWRW